VVHDAHGAGPPIVDPRDDVTAREPGGETDGQHGATHRRHDNIAA
jgi:hypothetical protein